MVCNVSVCFDFLKSLILGLVARAVVIFVPNGFPYAGFSPQDGDMHS